MRKKTIAIKRGKILITNGEDKKDISGEDITFLLNRIRSLENDIELNHELSDCKKSEKEKERINLLL